MKLQFPQGAVIGTLRFLHIGKLYRRMYFNFLEPILFLCV